MPPGSRFFYSGGGYTIIQLLMMDITQQPFDVLMKDLVLDPLGMHRSTFLQPLSPGRWMEAASGHNVAGIGLEGDWHVFPALAAAGLWTTSSDIARFAMGVQQAWHGLSNQVVSLETARLMTSPQFPHWGLGPAIGGQVEGEYFYHSGGNLGFRCEMIGFLHRDQGAVVMTNSDNGTDLCMQILRSIGEVYNWPACRSRLQKTIALSSVLANKYAGVYQSLDDPDRLAQVTFQNECLFIEVPGFFPPKFGIFPETENEFFSEEHGFRFKFIEADNELICEATILDMKYRSVKVRTSSHESSGGNHV
jgi:CubicO group peptidase (beta-lactamase class C family)